MSPDETFEPAAATDGQTRRQAVTEISLGLAALAIPSGISAARPAEERGWLKLPTVAYPGKQDDIVFVDRDTGWYGNGAGRAYGTRDGGTTWSLLWERPGTFVRALGFVDHHIGVLGNIGLDDFPGVTDSHPLYRTVDGGSTWTASNTIDGPMPKGICAIDVLRHPFIDAGVLATRVTLRAGGRVGGPAHLLTSRDLGVTWHSQDMAPLTKAILDIHFIDERTGFIAGATDGDVDVSNALVLMTTDAGASWRRVYRSNRPFETTWKLSFPSRRVGYVTVQNYDDDPRNAARVLAKTTDGGHTWNEVLLIRDHAVEEFGVGFLDELRGWVGGSTGGFETRDGGRTWKRVEMGRAVNKIRIVRDATGTRVFAIGRELHQLDLTTGP